MNSDLTVTQLEQSSSDREAYRRCAGVKNSVMPIRTAGEGREAALAGASLLAGARILVGH